MNSQMITLAYCLLLMSVFSALCLQGNRFQRLQINHPFPVQVLKLSAWPLLITLSMAAILILGWGFGLVTLFAAASLAAVTVIATLTYRPDKLPLLYVLPLAAGSICLAVVLL